MTAASLVLLPTLNEGGTIDVVLHTLLTSLDTDVLVIDDGSTDGTCERLDAWRKRYPSRLTILQRGHRLGLGTALIAGYRHALAHGYERVAQLDADLSHDPRIVATLLDGLCRADLVIGSRYVRGGRTEGWPRRRHVLSWLATELARTLAGAPVRDITSGFRAFRGEALRRIEPETLSALGYSVQVETAARAHRAGLRIREKPIVFRERRAGVSKMNTAVLLEWGRTVWRIRRALPGRRGGIASAKSRGLGGHAGGGRR